MRNRCRETLACGGVRAASRGLQWGLDEWAVVQLQTRKRKNASKQNDWPETETHEVDVMECEPRLGTRLAAAVRRLQTEYPYG